MADKTPEQDEYELLPHKEIVALREELQQLKQLPTQKHLQVGLVEVAQKIENLLDIFREAQETIRVEEGSLSLQEKLAPMMERMDKILEQNSQIAQGIVALADMLKEHKGVLGKTQPGELFSEAGQFSFDEGGTPPPAMPSAATPPPEQPAPSAAPQPLPRGPLPPPPKFQPSQ